MVVAQPGTIDFTVMYVTHDAFWRDLERFSSAVAAGGSYTEGVRAGWENFKNPRLWVLDGLGEADRNGFFAAMGKPVQIANTLIFQRRYDEHRLWAR